MMPAYRASDRASLHYDDLCRDTQAKTAPLIVLAGGAARHPSYLGDLGGLGDRYRLVVPHLRGVGESPMPDSVELASFWRQAEDMERLRIHLGLTQLVLVAHSAGSRLAISYAARFPAGVAGMVLITPPAGYLVDETLDTEALIERRRGERAIDEALAVRDLGRDIADDDAFDAWQRRMAPLAYASWGERERAHAATGRFSVAAMRAYFSVEPPGDLTDRLARVAAPVLVIVGGADCVTGIAPSLALARLFPAGAATVLDRCGHYPWVERPAAFREAVERFLGDRVLT